MDEEDVLPVVSEEGRVEVDHFEYVMVFQSSKREECDQISRRLTSANLKIEEEMSRDDDEIFLFITTDVDTFEKYAELLKVKKLVKSEYGRALDEFTRDNTDFFEGYTHHPSFFTSYERNMIILHIIEASRFRGGAKLDIGKLIKKGTLSQCFPLHDKVQKEKLMTGWIKRRWTSFSQPLDQIREYFGEYITFYFAWLEHYTKWLILPSIVGFVMLIVGLVLGWDNVVVPFYCLFIAIWGTVYLEFWKRKNAELVTLWDMRPDSVHERTRPSFKGERRYGVYIDGEFLPIDPDTTPNPPRVTWAPTSPRYFKLTVGLSMLTTFLGVVIVATLGVFLFRLFVRRTVQPMFGSIAGGVVNAVIILIFNTVYGKVATLLTDWENYRTEHEWESSFVVKNFLFQFVNSYVSLTYTAFVKGKFKLFGTEPDPCLPDCMSELTVLLGTIFLTNIFVGQAMEVGLPWASAKFFIWNENRSIHTNIEPSQAEVESKLSSYDSTFDDFNEMAIQFGYLILFAAAFPFAPIAALINNVVEMRTDAFKILMGMKRPHPRAALGIGRWFNILEIIGYMGVITNIGIIFYTSENAKTIFHNVEDSTVRLWYALAAEHLILVLKWILQAAIPNVPGWVRVLHAREEYSRLKAQEELEKRQRSDSTHSRAILSRADIDEGSDLD